MSQRAPLPKIPCPNCGKPLIAGWLKKHVDSCKGVKFVSRDPSVPKGTCPYCLEVITPSTNTAVHVVNCKLNPNLESIRSKQSLRKMGITPTDQARANMSKAQKGRKVSDETRAKMSKAHSVNVTGGGRHYGNVLDYDATNLKGDTYKVRGLWELDVANWLTLQGILWERNKVLYYPAVDGVVRCYNPDFWLPGHMMFIEVKGRYTEDMMDKMKRVLDINPVTLYMFHANVICAVREGKTFIEVLKLATRDINENPTQC